MEKAKKILPYFTIGIGIVGAVIAYVMFINNGGYDKQLTMFKEHGFLHMSFTSGTVSFVYGKIFGVLIGILLITQLILCIVSLFKNAKTVSKVFLYILCVLSLVTWILDMIFGFVISDETLAEIATKIGISNTTMNVILIGSAVLFAVIWVIVFAASGNGDSLLYILISLLGAYVAAPLLLWVIENIFNIAAIFIAVIVIILIIVIAVLIRNASKEKERKKKAKENETPVFEEAKTSESEASQEHFDGNDAKAGAEEVFIDSADDGDSDDGDDDSDDGDDSDE